MVVRLSMDIIELLGPVSLAHFLPNAGFLDSIIDLGRESLTIIPVAIHLWDMNKRYVREGERERGREGERERE
jgi:hypothetical protein